MERPRKLWLLKKDGQLFDDRIQEIFERLVYKFRRRFPRVTDDVDKQNIFEAAAHKFCEIERAAGKKLENPYGYAWSTVWTVAIDKTRAGSIESHRRRVESSSTSDYVASLPSPDATPEKMDRQVLLNEFRAQLSTEDELVFSGKMGGYSSRRIAKWRGCSPEAIDNMFSRIRKKLRRFIEENGGPKQPKK